MSIFKHNTSHNRRKFAPPIRTILIAAFLLVGLLPIVLMSVLAFNEAKTALTAEIKHDMRTRTQATATEIDRMMFERIQNVASWHQLELMQDIRIDDIDKRLSHFLNEVKTSYRDMYVDLFVIDASGNIIASSDSARIGQHYALGAHWHTVKMPQGAVALQAINQQRLPLSAEIIDTYTGLPLGQLVVEFNWRQIQKMLDASVFNASSAALFDAKNMLLASSTNWQKKPPQKSITVSEVANGYQNFASFGWRIEIIQPTTQVMAPVKRMTYIFIFLLVASILLAAIISIPVARVITNPLARLTQFANHISENSTRAPAVGGTAELRELSRAFNKMLADLALSKEALTRAAKLAVAGEMAAAMGHEIRTPLGILRSSAQVILREPGLSKESREVCGFIISETERLNALVTTLIESARPRALVFSPANITAIVRQAVGLLLAQAEHKNIQLICDTKADVMARCDADQMLQVMLNLILNAIQILPKGGKIKVQLAQETDSVTIKISDNGPGIAASQREQIFDPFFTKRAGGIGLGLAVVKQIITAHYGEISVHDNKPQGALFQIVLPDIKETS